MGHLRRFPAQHCNDEQCDEIATAIEMAASTGEIAAIAKPSLRIFRMRLD
jgi:hypothetical protein